MAETFQDSKNQNKNKPPGSSCFLGCFGFSGEKKISSDTIVELDANMKKKNKKKTSWFSWSRLRKKNKSPSETVPVVDASAAATAKLLVNQSREIAGVVKQEKKAVSATAGKVIQVPPPPSGKIITTMTKFDDDQDTNLENIKTLDDHDTSSCQKSIESAKIPSPTKKTSSQPGSPNNQKYEVSRGKGGLSHSISLPAATPASPVSPAKRKKQGMVAGGIPRVVNGENIDKQAGVAAKFDSMVGISIITVTLLIMLFWGKLCAILCTCAWFYIVPRFRAETESIEAAKNDSDSTLEIDLDSDEYKKKVVLEGFLERNRRSGI